MSDKQDQQSSAQPSPRPLDGLKILDFSHVLAGPFATRVLADMGADVVKINTVSRAQAANDPTHPYYIMWNRNKRALALDMSQPEGVALGRQLAEQADVVVDNFSVGVLDRWGIGYDTVSTTNKSVIYLQMSGMGDGGPWSKFVTYAPTIHALAGLTQLTGVEGREDIGIGVAYNDHQAGLHGAFAVLAALEAKRRTGVGQRIDVSQFEVGVNFAAPALFDALATGRAARPVGNRLPYDAAAPHGCYRCAPVAANQPPEQERWIAIACMDDVQWQALIGLMGSPDWATVAALQKVEGRMQALAQIDRAMNAWTATQDAYELMAKCQAAGVPAGVVQNGDDLANRDPQLKRSDFLHTIAEQDPVFGQTYADRLPLHFEKTPCEEYHRVRHLGEDNAAVLGDWLGMKESEIPTNAVESPTSGTT